MTADRPRALLVTQFYRPELIGSGPVCAELAEWLAQRGWQVTVITGLPHYPDAAAFAAERDRLPQWQIVNGVTVARVRSRMPKGRKAVSRIVSEASFLAAGLRLFLTGRVRRHELVISLCPSILSVALGTVARRRGGRHIAIVHDIQSGLAKGLGMTAAPGLVAAMRVFERWMLNRVDLAAVLTADMADQLLGLGVNAPIDLLPIWVDLDRFAAVIARPDGPVRIGYSGNFGHKQGLSQIIALAEVLQRKRPELSIVLRGKGSQGAELRRQIESRGLHNLRLEELLPADALHQALAETDIHLVPQAPDAADFALPSKIYNIMAAGRPFVATARPNSTLWHLERMSGAFICALPNNPVAFADAVERLADDASLRRALGDRGRQFVARHNAKAKVLEAFEARILQLTAG
jgi:colanic acid biosynthesis glycosyl transferase WcaI